LSVHQVHRVIRTALEQAVRWSVLVRNPAATAKPARAHERALAVFSINDW
jgi:hypothetical protein